MLERFFVLFKYFILSIIQGIGEVLPISSSGHLSLFEMVLGVDDNGVGLELLLHLASLLALFVYYNEIIIKLVKGSFNYTFKKSINNVREYKFVKGMIVSLIPTCVVGYFFNDYLDSFLRYPFLIGLFLILNSINLYLIRNKECSKSVEELPNMSFFKIGLGQCLGLIPGFSRSGSALSMCYREKMNKEDSQTFTFLMLFPLVIGSIIMNVEDFSFIDGEGVLFFIMFIVTFVFTLVSVKLLEKIIKSNKLHYFAYYCFVLGVILMFIG